MKTLKTMVGPGVDKLDIVCGSLLLVGIIWLVITIKLISM
jgi:hypothetical protein